MWITSFDPAFRRPIQPPSAEVLLGVAWLRVAAAREAYGYGDLDNAQRHARIAATTAGQALATHRGMPYAASQDDDQADLFCREQFGEPVERMLARIQAFGEVRMPDDDALSNEQHDVVQDGLDASSEIVALIEGTINS